MLYEKCAEVSADYWQQLRRADPGEVQRRTGAVFRESLWQLPFLSQELCIFPQEERLEIVGREAADPGFLLCLTALLYLLKVDPQALGPPVSPLELTGATTFFQDRGPHALPTAPLEKRFGASPADFIEAGRRLGAAPRPNGDAALALPVFPGFDVGVILWQADEEFPAQVSFTVPGNLHHFWQLDAVLALLQLVVQELLAVSSP